MNRLDIEELVRQNIPDSSNLTAEFSTEGDFLVVKLKTIVNQGNQPRQVVVGSFAVSLNNMSETTPEDCEKVIKAKFSESFNVLNKEPIVNGQ